MPSDSPAQSLEGLSDVNRLTVVIVESINTPFAVADFLSMFVKARKEGTDLLANGRNIGRKTDITSFTDWQLFGS